MHIQMNAEKTVEVSDWLAANKSNFWDNKKKRYNRRELGGFFTDTLLAQWATEDLGFKVTRSNIRTLRVIRYGQYPGRKQPVHLPVPVPPQLTPEAREVIIAFMRERLPIILAEMGVPFITD